MPAPKGNQYAVGNVGGRPTKYIPEYAEQARKLCKLGATRAQLADFFNVAYSQIGAWAVRHEEFQIAIKTSRGTADDTVEASFYMRAVGFTHQTQRKTQEVEFYVDEKTRETKSRVKKEVTISEEVYYPPEWGASYSWLKNRRPAEWRERSEVNGNVNVSGTVEHQHAHQLLPVEAVAALTFDEVQRLASEEIVIAPGVSLLPPPAPAGDAPVRDES